MEVFHAKSKKRETYEVRITSSTLWECALGIAAITNRNLIDTLEMPEAYWQELRGSFSKELSAHLDYVEKHNTWKSLLQLLHEKEWKGLSEFTEFIHRLSPIELKCICLPFTGTGLEEVRKQAANNDELAVKNLKEATKETPFFPDYIAFISQAEPQALKEHLIAVMTGWYEAVIRPSLDETKRILKTDHDMKLQMSGKMNPEELVQWATGGVTYAPEPSVHYVLLIPHAIYRPWNIEADLIDTKVFYYPVSNESISPGDKYTPSNFLALKHKALGDETRLRMVKLLSEQDRSLQEFTDILDIGKSTIHHHLKLLRSAKIVSIVNARYALKENAVEMLAKELEIYIKQ